MRTPVEAHAPSRHGAAPSGSPAAKAVVAVGSGKGGVGTSTIAALLAATMAEQGRRVLLVDAGQRLGGLHHLLGVEPAGSLGQLRGGREPHDLLVPVAERLSLFPASLEEAELRPTERRLLMRRVAALFDGFELVVIDAGSSAESLVAACADGATRLLAVTAGDRISLVATYALCKAVHTRHRALPVDVLVNRHEGSEAARCFDAIDAGARQFLGLSLRLAGAIPADPTLDAALRRGMPFPDAAAGSPAALAAHDVVMRALSVRSPSRSGV
jgi:flagellar biosynthesis protein FlhG